MARDLTVSEIVFQHLLEHIWFAKDKGYPREFDQAPNGYLITYGKLIELSQVPLSPRNAGGPLFDIAGYCAANGLPPIHALVVAKETGMPGDGFFRAPGSSYAGLGFDEAFQLWRKDVESCMSFDNYVRTAPNLS
jgi:hypothetical protein